jgi:trehalose utilization protein
VNKLIDRRALLHTGLARAGSVLLADGVLAAEQKQRARRKVVVWSEGSAPKNIYPNDVNTAIAEGLKPLKGWEIVTANLSDPDQGLPDSLLNQTSVLVWWGHLHHGDVKDELVSRIVKRVKEDGMGWIGTHSAHWSKPFKELMGTTGSWNGGYVEDGSKLDVIVKAPKHPIAKGIKDFVVPHTERYTEPFVVPTPETLVFDGLYTRPNGSTEPSRQGMTWTVGKGRVFYFQPGHESYPIYFQEEIRQVFRNAVPWAAAKQEG